MKAEEQIGKDVLRLFEYCFFENGLVAYHNAELIHKASLKEYLGEEKLKKFISKSSSGADGDYLLTIQRQR